MGAAVWQNGPSPALLERLSVAEELYHEGYAPAIITTGGTGTLNPTPEGTAARLTLIARGIPPDVVYEEVKSRNTRENLTEARKIMQQYGWKKAVIVTHDYHLLRAINEARRVGIDASGCGVQKTAMFRPPLVLREVIANLVRLIV
ncbi:MAG: YdcF family protein [Moorella sp. (in: firmicutes)]